MENDVVDPVNQNRGIKRKRNCDPFVQDVSCWKASKFLPRCRDCAVRSADDVVTLQECRFQHFRKLVRKSSDGPEKKRFYVEFDGFCDPETDPNKVVEIINIIEYYIINISLALY